MFVRILLVLLVLAQIALLIFFYPRLRDYLSGDAVEPQTQEQAVVEESEGIHLRAAEGFEVPPSVEVTTNRVSGQECREIGDFAEEESARAVADWLKGRGAGGRMDTRVTISEQRFRVYVGEFNQEEEAVFAQQVVQKRNYELKNALIYKSGEHWRVSFGQFEQKQEAEDFKRRLETMVKGLRVYIDTRQRTDASVSLRYLEEDARRLGELADDADLSEQLQAYSVDLRNCN